MNKYLTRFNKLLDELNEESEGFGYELLSKMDIASYFNDNFSIYDENNNIVLLTDAQEEQVIDIIYEYYIDSTYDKMSEYSATMAVINVLEEYENNFDEFINDYENNYETICEKFDNYLD